ncbi:MAG: uracil-DNA glycosylase [Cocleimonas sp.]|nr:uracil-DNA glycosylase [Cocleimonas sp.]
MTSPAQLKYLDAIGIPVWVSRDIVVDADVTKSVTGDEQSREEKYSGADSVESILQGLNEQPKPVTPHPVSKEHQPIQSPIVSPVQDTTPQVNEIARTTSHIVYGCGSLQADWMVIGESPELNDDRQDQPYAGESGVLLSNMLRAVGLENPRQSAYLVNIIKSSMQAVEPDSVGELNQLLTKKILEVKPNIILVVGQLSAQNLLQSKEPLARLRVKALKHPETNTDIVVTYYPSYLLSKPIDKRKAWEDLKRAMRLLEASGSTPE